MPPESTPLTLPPVPARTPISPAFPFRTATSRESRSRQAVSVRNRVAPAPTGSRMTGMPRTFARRPAMSIASTCPCESVPMLRTRAPAAETISATSSGASAITGAAPAEIVMFAQSLIVTLFVIWCTRGRCDRTAARRPARIEPSMRFADESSLVLPGITTLSISAAIA